MNYAIRDVNCDCSEFYEDWGHFLQETRIFVKAIRRIQEGMCRERRLLDSVQESGEEGEDGLRERILERHEASFIKVAKGLRDYTYNYSMMEAEYRALLKKKDEYTRMHFTKVEVRRRQLCTQRDLILGGIENLVKLHLRAMSLSHDKEEKKDVLEGEKIFKIVEVYNGAVVQLKKGPLRDEDDENMEKYVYELRAYYNFLPDTLTSLDNRAKKLTASKILQTVASVRKPKVTECIARTFFSNFEFPKENGVRLPWKPIFVEGVYDYGHVDIFEEAITKEEDETKLDQKKLDFALKMEFGEDFSGINYLPSSEEDKYGLLPLPTHATETLVKSNNQFLSLLLTKFTKTRGILVDKMLKKGKTGDQRLGKTSKQNLEAYYVEKVWGEGMNLVEEIVLWCPPLTRPPPFPPPVLMKTADLVFLCDTFRRYSNRDLIPTSCSISCEAVIEECRHFAEASFLDAALVRGFGHYAQVIPKAHKLPDGNYSTPGGEGLVDAVQLLVWDINEIEATEVEKEGPNWPVAEEVGFLLCLGAILSSALSSLRLRITHLMHTWNMAPFYLLAQSDLPRIIEEIKKLKIEERDNLVKSDDMGRLQSVLRREKLAAIIEALIINIKDYEEEAVQDVSAVCRTVSLAHLQNSMPPPWTWGGIGRLPHEPHYYVFEYIATVLEPVMDAVTKLGVDLQRRAGSTILKVVCYSWLEHIKAQKIRFSMWGAQQLLKDFHALADWLQNYPGLAPEARAQILSVDVLRECEGVARLLMRQPPMVVGYTSQNQIAPMGTISAGRKYDKDVRLTSEDDDIPAEMYVPNQQLWLSLRNRSNSSIFSKMATCCAWPY